MDLRVKLGQVSYPGWPPGLGVPGKTVSYSWRRGPGKNTWSFIPPEEVGGGTLAWGQRERGLSGGRSSVWCQEREEEIWETCEEGGEGSHSWWGQM